MKKASIVTFKDAHFWKKDNKYILTGYRKHHNTIQKILQSLKTKHNELMNVWTHLIPTILLITYTIFFTINTIIYSEDELPISFTLPLLLAYTFAIFCLGSSSVYHLFSSLSCKTCRNLIRYDYFGIMLCIYVFAISSFYYVFHYSTVVMMSYIMIITLAIFFVMFIIVSPKYQADEFRNLRTFAFISMVAVNIFPIVHALVNSYYDVEDNDMIDYFEAFYYVMIEFVFFGIGVFFFINKYPEKAFPKKFDIWMNSHTLWHIFVVLGIFMQIKALNLFYTQRKFCILENSV